ncbi:uncharacterized protein VTP21DRAFT_6180 [Calcarisporiella thermophila]|uniref:uncharacterized protein n=1 Tax=Calcarisporiella thermophila TaxID=911321 RepID=UPI003743C11A
MTAIFRFVTIKTETSVLIHFASAFELNSALFTEAITNGRPIQICTGTGSCYILIRCDLLFSLVPRSIVSNQGIAATMKTVDRDRMQLDLQFPAVEKATPGITLATEIRAKTAFRTHTGLHQYTRMPFEQKNGLQFFRDL